MVDMYEHVAAYLVMPLSDFLCGSESALLEKLAVRLMIEAVKKMKFQPGLKGGQPTDWPGLTSSLKLTKPDN